MMNEIQDIMNSGCEYHEYLERSTTHLNKYETRYKSLKKEILSLFLGNHPTLTPFLNQNVLPMIQTKLK